MSAAGEKKPEEKGPPPPEEKKPEEKKDEPPADLKKAVHEALDQSGQALAGVRRIEAQAKGEKPPEDPKKKSSGWQAFKRGFLSEDGVAAEDDK